MNRTTTIAAMVLVGIAIGATWYFDDAQPGAPQPMQRRAQNDARDEAMSADEFLAAHIAAADHRANASAPMQPTAAQLANAARGDDPDKRAAAIDALARVPKAQALPVLQPLLSATAQDDRQRVVGALHTMAVEQGDDDGRIGEILRLTIYDGDDAGVADSAQTVLDDIQQETAEPGS